METDASAIAIGPANGLARRQGLDADKGGPAAEGRRRRGNRTAGEDVALYLRPFSLAPQAVFFLWASITISDKINQ